MARLDGRVLIVTGGTQGIGEALAVYAAEHGAAGVVVCGRQKERGAEVAARVERAGCAALYVQADLSVVEDCRHVVQACDERFGRVDGLANVAADTRRGTLDSTTVEFWDYLFAVNVRAPFVLTQEAVRIMRREKIAGAIVNVLSVASYCGAPKLTAYSTTKGALSTFTKNAANALRGDRIRVNGIQLGWTDTPAEHVIQQQEDGNPPDWLETAERASAFGRLLKPREVARLCAYLLSDDSGIVTGSLMDYSQRVMGLFPTEP